MNGAAPEPKMVLDALNIAEGAAASAGGHLLRDRDALADVLTKEGRDVKLRGDFASESVILAHLSERSGWPILSEETGWVGPPPSPSVPYWVIDPLDGSFNYYRRIPFCCISIALCLDRRPLAGVVFDFERDELFRGGCGVGATFNGKPMMAPAMPEPGQAVLASGFPLGSDPSRVGVGHIVGGLVGWKKVRMLGSAALSIAYVAAGRLDAYQEQGIRWWDVAGSLAILDAAGGEWVANGDIFGDPGLDVAAQGRRAGP